MIVRSTVNLPGLPAGRTAKVDPSKPYIQRCLRAGFLTPVFLRGFNGETEENVEKGSS